MHDSRRNVSIEKTQVNPITCNVLASDEKVMPDFILVRNMNTYSNSQMAENQKQTNALMIRWNRDRETVAKRLPISTVCPSARSSVFPIVPH